MLDDQPFLIDSTTFLSQCNCMTITGLYLQVEESALKTEFFTTLQSSNSKMDVVEEIS